MIILIGGATHTGKTVLAQRLLEKYHYSYLSIDHLKMGLIRSGHASLSAYDDRKLIEYLWPIVRNMIKTAIDNKQNLIVEGCYIPFDWGKDFSEEHRKQICCRFLVMSDSYIEKHFDDILRHANDIEQRIYGSDISVEKLILQNKYVLRQCKEYRCKYILLDKEYRIDLEQFSQNPPSEQKKTQSSNFTMVEVLFIVVIAVIMCFCFLLLISRDDYYRADMAAVESLSAAYDVQQQTLENGTVIYGDPNSENGLIFYPDSKVEHIAYEPLMKAVASRGVFCVLVKMPQKLVMFGVDAADQYRETFEQVERWFIGGHSSGGITAARHVDDREDAYTGLILLASYSVSDLSDTDLQVLSIYCSEDRILDFSRFWSYQDHLPEDAKAFAIHGGCHAYFGAYAEQKGDGIPKITLQEQQNCTAEQIVALICDRAAVG